MHLGLAIRAIQAIEDFVRLQGHEMRHLHDLKSSIENTRRGGVPSEDMEEKIRELELNIHNIYYWLKAASAFVPKDTK